MSIAELRDLTIVIYGALGVLILLVFLVLSVFITVKLISIMNDVKSIMEKARAITTYISQEIIEPIVELAVIVNSATQGIRQMARMFKGRKGKEDVQKNAR